MALMTVDQGDGSRALDSAVHHAMLSTRREETEALVGSFGQEVLSD